MPALILEHISLASFPTSCPVPTSSLACALLSCHRLTGFHLPAPKVNDPCLVLHDAAVHAHVGHHTVLGRAKCVSGVLGEWMDAYHEGCACH
eukprot:1158376-Pelagomonas_calceolata.AAC.17